MRRCVLLLWAISLWGQTPVTPRVTQMVVFGDSLSDTGNAYLATKGTSTPEPPLPPLYTVGEFTDGPDTIPATTGPLGLWDQQLAKILGLPAPLPYLAGGTCYAVASALTGTNPAFNGTAAQAPYVTDQLNLFLAKYPSQVPSDTLYVFWAGANDIPASVDPVMAASNIAGNIQTLASRGAKYFLWLNLPPLGDTPEGSASGFGFLLNAASTAFNTAWAAAIVQLQTANPGIAIAGADVNTLFANIVANPSTYGFTNVTSPAQGVAGANPNTYVFWDGEHPTTESDSLVATVAYNRVQAALGVPQILGAVNAASGAAGSVSPGMLTLLGGVNLGPAVLVPGQLNPQTNLAATTVSNTQVFFDEFPAAIFYVQNNQTVAVAPYEIAGRATTNITVEYQGVTSAAFP